MKNFLIDAVLAVAIKIATILLRIKEDDLEADPKW